MVLKTIDYNQDNQIDRNCLYIVEEERGEESGIGIGFVILMIVSIRRCVYQVKRLEKRWRYMTVVACGKI